VLVLLVEDHPPTRERYAAFLAGRGALVETAVNGRQAMAKATLTAPDAIVVDLGLRSRDARETTRRLRASLHTSNVPIIALGGRLDPRTEHEVVAGGASVVLAKPCRPGVLWEALLIVCRRRFRPALPHR
jgi:DNA-binding response OmpR family regulator